MPPKPKFTREEVVDTAIELIKDKGIEALTARELGAKLGSSARPIFTVFRNMEELISDVRKSVQSEFEKEIMTAFEYTPAFKQFGMRMVKFATEEPKLFQFLFMKEHTEASSFNVVFGELGEHAQKCINCIKRDYDVNDDEAQILFQQAWIFTYSVSMLCATKMCSFSENQLVQMFGRMFISLLLYVKAGNLDVQTPKPQKKD